MFQEEGKTFTKHTWDKIETMLNRVKDYTIKNELIWKEKYFNPKPKLMQTSVSQPQEPNLMQKPKLKGFGDYMADVKQIGNRIWDKYIPKMPTYKVSKYIAVPKMALDHWLNMDNKNIIDIGKQAYNIYQDYNEFEPLGLNDKYKHAMLNCRAAQRGQTGEDLVTFLSRLKEYNDVYLRKNGKNTWSESIQDSQANALGRSLGRLYKDGNCEEMVSKHIKRNY